MFRDTPTHLVNDGVLSFPELRLIKSSDLFCINAYFDT
jgi:hypothetical protein